jgi:CheY-like chemotaxis protein
MILDGEETKEIFTLAVPALGALLADPLMSLIDTMFVGRIGVNELTALGPNAAIFQVIFQLFSFLSITTTGMVARHYVKFNEGCEIAEYKIRRSVSISLFFSVAFGMVSLIALNCFASDILRVVGTPESLLATAAPYLRIRAFATPFVLASYCAQGAFIGKLDSKTPLRIFAFAAVLNVFAVAAVLERREMTVLCADSGSAALEELETNPDVDIVLMDIMMPVMNGYDSMRAIRKDNKIKNIPIIALTAKAQAEDKQLCIDAGANDYMSKPIDHEQLLSLLKIWLKNEGSD